MGIDELSKRARFFKYLRYARDRAAEGHLPVHRQIFEMFLLFIYRGLGPGYYHFGRFWRREIPLHDKLNHLNERDYIRMIAKINNPNYRKLSQNKIAEKAMLSLFGIPTPKFYGHLHTTTGYSCYAEPLRDAANLAALIEKERPNRICFKYVEGWGGSGFEAAEVDYGVSPPRLSPLPDGDSLDLETYLTRRIKLAQDPMGRVLEEYCQQHSWYASLNPTSVNTIRVYASVPPGLPVRILGGYLRIGRKGSLTDNASTGGLFCPLDPDTGILEGGRFDKFDTLFYSKHPDNGIQLEGSQLPRWNEVRTLIQMSLDIFYGTRFAGLDIAMTEDGPTIIELNVQPDRTAACDLDITTKDMLTP